MENKIEFAPVEPGWPAQLEFRVPFEPTAFPSAGRSYLIYELHLRNFGYFPLDIRKIEVLDASSSAAAPVAAFDAEQLGHLSQPIGGQTRGGEGADLYLLAPGGSAIINLMISLGENEPVPDSLRHRVSLAGSTLEGAEIGTHATRLAMLGPPVQGTNWSADDGPSSDSHHRGIAVLDGRAVISRRYAIDWIRVVNGATFSGDSLDYTAYHAYGEPVLAVADGRVVSAVDGLPDNVPGHGESFHPAVPISMETVAGNRIILDVGGGQFAYTMHLQPGSLSVKAGDRVRQGQVLARLGNSGDSREPHLHFEVTDSAGLLRGEGVPYLIDAYRVKSDGDSWQTRKNELPLKDMLIDFGDHLTKH